MNKQHTPGPWQQGTKEWDRNMCVYSGGRIIVSCSPAYMSIDITDEQKIANARLCAAAPDLLYQLKETHAALCMGDSSYLGSLRYNENRAAIEKAQGYYFD